MASGSNNVVDEIENAYKAESRSEKLLRKSQDAPFVPIGIGAALGALVYGAVKFRNRGSMSTSIYLIHMRVAAQSAIVGAMTIGVTYTLLRDYVFNSPEKKEVTQ